MKKIIMTWLLLCASPVLAVTIPELPALTSVTNSSQLLVYEEGDKKATISQLLEEVHSTITDGSNMVEHYDGNDVLRTFLNSYGKQKWYLGSDGVGTATGSIYFGTPGSFPGILIYTAADTNRFNMINTGDEFKLYFQDTPDGGLVIDRVTGNVEFGGTITVLGSFTDGTNSATITDIIAAANSPGGYEFTGSALLDQTSMSAGTTYNATDITVTGAALGDFCVASRNGSDLVGLLSVKCMVISANTVKLILKNETGGSIDPASQTYYVGVNSHP
jgi:hypothetical protein